jgi:hypothetical protein
MFKNKVNHRSVFSLMNDKEREREIKLTRTEANLTHFILLKMSQTYSFLSTIEKSSEWDGNQNLVVKSHNSQQNPQWQSSIRRVCFADIH